jgi:hypothetical protein
MTDRGPIPPLARTTDFLDGRPCRLAPICGAFVPDVADRASRERAGGGPAPGGQGGNGSRDSVVRAYGRFATLGEFAATEPNYVSGDQGHDDENSRPVTWHSFLAWASRATGIGYSPVPPRSERPEIIRMNNATRMLQRQIDAMLRDDGNRVTGGNTDDDRR